METCEQHESCIHKKKESACPLPSLYWQMQDADVASVSNPKPGIQGRTLAGERAARRTRPGFPDDLLNGDTFMTLTLYLMREIAIYIAILYFGVFRNSSLVWS